MTPQERAELEAEREAIRAELVRRGRIQRTPIAVAAARSLGDALSFGLGDEFQGALASAGYTGEEADRRRNEATARARRNLEEARSDRPVTSFVSGAGAMLIPGAGAMRIGRAVTGASRLQGALNAARATPTAANAARAVALAPRVARANRTALYGSSVAQGAVYGAGSANDGDRVLGAGIGGAAGAGGAALGEALGGVYASVRGMRDPVTRAERLLSRELQESVPNEADLARRLVRCRFNPNGMTPTAARAEARRIVQAGRAGRFTGEDLARRANWAHPRANQPTMMDLMPRGQRTARAIHATGGPGEAIIDQALDAQSQSLGRDIAVQARNTLRPRGVGPGGTGRSGAGRGGGIDNQPPPTGLQEFNERLVQASQAQNAIAYNAAYRARLAPAQQASAARRMTGGSFKEQARKSAIERAEEDVARLSDDLDDLQTSGGDPARIQEVSRELEDVVVAKEALTSLGSDSPNIAAIDTTALDLYQRGLRALADEAGGGATERGRNIAAVRRTFMNNVRSISPELHAAVSGARGFKALEKARTLGQGLFRPSKEQEIDQLLRRAMTTDEQDAFMVGALDAIEARLGANDLAAVRALQRNENWRALVMRSARSRRAGQRFLDLIDDKVQQVNRTNYVRGGSSSAPTQEDVRRLTNENDLSFVQDVVEAGGNVQGPIMRRVASAADRVIRPGIRNPQVQTEMARMLTQPGTMANAQALAARLAMAPKASIFTQQGQQTVGNVARGVSGAGVAGAQQTDRPVSEYSNEELERIAAGQN